MFSCFAIDFAFSVGKEIKTIVVYLYEINMIFLVKNSIYLNQDNNHLKIHFIE
jgi:hypothetical protein